MTSELSTVVQAVITDENEKYFFVQKSGETFRLKKDDATESLKIGDVVTGFLYENSSRKKVFTLRIPEVTNESYGWASVTQVRLVGTTIITPEGYKLFLHPSERMYEPTLGEEITVRVIGLRPDGVLNVSMRPRAHEAIGDDAEMIVAMLKNRPTHTLPYWDKTDPKTIKEIFGISKGQFKRAIGNLLKAKRITQEEGFIHLIEE